MLNSIKFKTKKIICCFVLCLGMLASAENIKVTREEIEEAYKNAQARKGEI